jgi:ABC-type iron transport system FetAB permease component
MSCNINRSINVGFISAIVLALVSYLFLPYVKNLDNTKLLFLFVVFFVIATSMDYFNYCYTKCYDIKSSIKYGIFTVALIYLFYSLFVGVKLDKNYLIPIGGNIIFLTVLHYFLCNIRDLEKPQNVDYVEYIELDQK